MNTLIKTLWNRTRSAFDVLGNGCDKNSQGCDCTLTDLQPAPDTPSIAEIKPGNRVSEPQAPGSPPDSLIPIRICPHCGYEIRTWILGDLSCTRCENDIRPGEGMGSTLYFRASDIRTDASFRV